MLVSAISPYHLSYAPPSKLLDKIFAQYDIHRRDIDPTRYTAVLAECLKLYMFLVENNIRNDTFELSELLRLTHPYNLFDHWHLLERAVLSHLAIPVFAAAAILRQKDMQTVFLPHTVRYPAPCFPEYRNPHKDDLHKEK